MKNIIYFPTFLMVLVITMTTCKEDPTNTVVIEDPPRPFVVQSHIEIDALENWLPQAYFNEDPKVVYVNERGEEKSLNIYMVRSEKDKIYNGQDYIAENFSVRLRDADDITFEIDIDGDAIYGPEDELQKRLLAFLMPRNDNGSMAVIVRFDENGSKVTMFDIFNEEVSFFSHTYKDVYKGGTSIPDLLLHDSFAEVAINSEVGVVYFRDRVNDLWVFDRFE